MNSKVGGLLGICRRAGHLTVGFDAVKALVSARRAALVLLAADVSEKTAKEIRFLTTEAPCPTVCASLTKTALAGAIGLSKPVGVVATDDSGFAAAIQKHIPAVLKEEDAL